MQTMLASSPNSTIFVLFYLGPFVVVPLWLFALVSSLALVRRSAVKITRLLAKVAFVMTLPIALIGALLLLTDKDERGYLVFWLWGLGVVWMPAVLCASWYRLAWLLERRAAAAGRAVTPGTRRVALGAGVLGWVVCVAGLYYLPQMQWP